MQQKTYTIEGREYIVRSTSLSLFIAAATYDKLVSVNAGGIFAPYIININTSRPIIPVSYSFSAISVATSLPVVDITNCYYYVFSGIYPGHTLFPAYLNSLLKSYPYIQRIYYTDQNNNNFNIQYNQLIFSDSDFLSTGSNLFIFPTVSLAASLNGSGAADESIVLAEDCNMTSTFTYLELQ